MDEALSLIFREWWVKNRHARMTGRDRRTRLSHRRVKLRDGRAILPKRRLNFGEHSGEGAGKCLFPGFGRRYFPHLAHTPGSLKLVNEARAKVPPEPCAADTGCCF